MAHALKSKPIYESLLERLLEKRGTNLEHGSEQKRLIETVVEVGCHLEGKKISDVKWPDKCLVVGIRRGENEILPKGDTVIDVGDTIVVLLDIPGATIAEGYIQECCKGRI